MSFIQIYDESVSDEFGSFLNTIKPNVDKYIESKTSAQQERMIIIGKIAEYRQQFPQRSTDHRALSEAMTSEGWSEDIIQRQSVAYRQQQTLLNSGVDEFRDVAEVASPSQLYEMGSAKDKTVVFDAAKHLKKTGKLPAVKALRGHKGGFTNSSFEPSFHKKPDFRQEPQVTPEPYVVTEPSIDVSAVSVSTEAVTAEPVIQTHTMPETIINKSTTEVSSKYEVVCREFEKMVMSDYKHLTPEDKKWISNMVNTACTWARVEPSHSRR